MKKSQLTPKQVEFIAFIKENNGLTLNEINEIRASQGLDPFKTGTINCLKNDYFTTADREIETITQVSNNAYSVVKTTHEKMTPKNQEILDTFEKLEQPATFRQVKELLTDLHIGSLTAMVKKGLIVVSCQVKEPKKSKKMVSEYHAK